MLEERLLDPSRHDRQAFVSGVIELDDYLRRFAAQQSKKGVAAVRVLVDTEAPGVICGYYSLSAAQIDVSQLESSMPFSQAKDSMLQKQLPRYPVPCFRMGRLATALAFRGQGLGRILVGCAVARCLQARKHVAAVALLVDTKMLLRKPSMNVMALSLVETIQCVSIWRWVLLSF